METISRELLRKFFKGECTPAEEQMIIEWYNSFDEKDNPYEKLTSKEKDELRRRMLGHIKTRLSPSEVRNNRDEKVRYFIYALAAAAIVVIMLNLPLLFKPAAHREQNAQVSEENIVFTNTTATLSKKILPDRSTIWLSPGARITYSKHFKGRLREVRLVGESFFEVTKDHAHPFVIYSPHVTTKVWGTSFRINDFIGKRDAEVVVVTGKVSVGTAHPNTKRAQLRSLKTEEVMLTPKQKVVYSWAEQKLRIGEVSKLSSINMWNKADLSFNNITLAEAIQILNKQFNVEISLDDDSLSKSKIKADFNDESFPEIIDILTKLLNMAYVTDGRRFVLHKAPSN